MPAPISNRDSTTDSPFFAPAESCDPATSSCAPPVETQASASEPPSITLDPVHVTGDLGTRRLVEQSERRTTQDCTNELRSAWLSCANAGATTLCAVASAITVVGAVGGAVATLVAGVNCGKDLALLDACEER